MTESKKQVEEMIDRLRQDLTDKSNFMAKLSRAVDEKNSLKLHDVEKLLDQARHILFDIKL